MSRASKFFEASAKTFVLVHGRDRQFTTIGKVVQLLLLTGQHGDLMALRVRDWKVAFLEQNVAINPKTLLWLTE